MTSPRTSPNFGLQIDDVEQIGDILKGQHLGPVFHWLNNVLITERMVGEIQEASSRISELVTSVKTYTHMDRLARPGGRRHPRGHQQHTHPA